VSVTELVGLGALDEERADHRAIQEPAAPQAGERLNEILAMFGLAELNERFFVPAAAAPDAQPAADHAG
jgi:hypothetical protein